MFVYIVITATGSDVNKTKFLRPRPKPIFCSQTGLVLRPTVSDHISGHGESCFHRHLFVCLLARLRRKVPYSTDFGTLAKEERLDFGGITDHVRWGLG